jgi:hypothetical protein
MCECKQIHSNNTECKTKQNKKEEKSTLQKRARSKAITDIVMRKLLALPETPLRQGYRNTYYCASVIEVDSVGKQYTKYCKNRWCLVCNRIRIAKLMNQYLPEINKWKKSQFVTLTIKNVPAEKLHSTIRYMNQMFGKITATLRRKKFRGKISAYSGLKKIECTYNYRTNEYHPHFHLIVNSSEVAEFIRSEWIRLYDDKQIVDPQAQDIKAIDKKKQGAAEIFKYFTKLISYDYDDEKKIKESAKINAVALDVIFQSIKRIDIFTTFGDLVAVDDDFESDNEEPTTNDEQKTDARKKYYWEQGRYDWITRVVVAVEGQRKTEEYEKRLSGYIPHGDFMKFMEKLDKGGS